jgi:hypothetical protein
MTSIRVAIASALVLAAVFAGGATHAKPTDARTGARAVALAGVPMSKGSPVLCC